MGGAFENRRVGAVVTITFAVVLSGVTVSGVAHAAGPTSCSDWTPVSQEVSAKVCAEIDHGAQKTNSYVLLWNKGNVAYVSSKVYNVDRGQDFQPVGECAMQPIRLGPAKCGGTGAQPFTAQAKAGETQACAIVTVDRTAKWICTTPQKPPTLALPNQP
jgi:hypothetical protein